MDSMDNYNSNTQLTNNLEVNLIAKTNKIHIKINTNINNTTHNKIRINISKVKVVKVELNI